MHAAAHATRTAARDATNRVAAAHGFTLIEAAVVVAIIGIVATAAVPSLGAMLQARRLDGAATQLAADLQFARSEAVLRHQAMRWTLHTGPAGTCYVLHTGPADACPCDIDTPARCEGDAQAFKTVMLPAAERIALQSNAASLLFDPLHGTSSPGATLRVIGADARVVHQVVNVMGRVRSCSPNAAVSGYRAC